MQIDEMGTEGVCASSRLGEKKQKPSTYWAFSYFRRMGKGHGQERGTQSKLVRLEVTSEGEWHERKLHDPDTRFMGSWEYLMRLGQTQPWHPPLSPWGKASV